MEYAKWYSVVCNTYSKSLDELGINVDGDKCEFNKGIGPVIADAAAQITYAQALQLADEYKPDLGYRLRQAYKERAEMYAADPVQLNEPPKPLWELKPLQRNSDELRNALFEVLEKAPKDQPYPKAAAILAPWRNNPKLPTGILQVDQDQVHYYDSRGAEAVATVKAINDRIKSMLVKLDAKSTD
jgi:hypothetical protein